MARRAQRDLLLILVLMLCNTVVLAQGDPPQDNMINGERFPDGYTPMEIKNGIYPRAYSPNTEKLSPNEMRVTALYNDYKLEQGYDANEIMTKA